MSNLYSGRGWWTLTEVRDLPQVTGIYIALGPLGLYVGQSVDCYDRNEQLTRLGVPWGIVREMPGSTRRERCQAESEVAEHWAARGWALISRNTTDHLRYACGRLGPRHTSETRVRMSRSRTGKHLSAETRAKIGDRQKRSWARGRKGPGHTPESRAKISAGLTGKRLSAETRAKIGASRKRAWEAARAE